MHISSRSLAALAISLPIVAALFTGDVAAQSPTATIRGEVTDMSGGVLPGVTVVATAADGRQIGRTFTDQVGGFVFLALPVGNVKVSFELDGFEPSSVDVVLYPDAETRVVERLKLARMTEQVVVYGKAPLDPPPFPIPDHVTPRPTLIPVPPQQLETICKPARAAITGEFLGKIERHRWAEGRALYGKGDELVVDGGTSDGIEVGQNLVVRRQYRANSRAEQLPELGEHTAGLVQIVSAKEHSANAVVVHVCNEVMQGDVLAAFMPEPARTPEPAGAPEYDDAALILFGDAGQLLGVARRLMVIDRGSEEGIQVGQRLTLFRRKADLPRPVVLGEAVVISVRSNSATIRIVSATEAIEFGDRAAVQRPSPVASRQ